MNRESEVVPRLRPDFAARVVRQARIEQRRRRVRRRVGVGLGAMVVFALGALSLGQRFRAHPLRDSSSFAALDFDDGASSTDGMLSLIDGTNETQGDDPAEYFFPDSESLTASASD